MGDASWDVVKPRCFRIPAPHAIETHLFLNSDLCLQTWRGRCGNTQKSDAYIVPESSWLLIRMQPNAYRPRTLLGLTCQNGAQGSMLTLSSMPLTVLGFPGAWPLLILFYSIDFILFFFFIWVYLSHHVTLVCPKNTSSERSFRKTKFLPTKWVTLHFLNCLEHQCEVVGFFLSSWPLPLLKVTQLY